MRFWSARPIVMACALAGTLDILAAFTFYAVRRVSPVRVLQSVASGLLGAASFSGGAPTAVLGLLLHFFIATTAASVYYVASRRLPLLLRRPFACGALYGVIVYVVMTFIVVPLSAAPRRPFAWGPALIMVMIHIVCVGMPIAWATRRYRRALAQAAIL
jgi:hypothetical protein